MTEQDWGVNIIHDSTKSISNDPISLTHTPLPNMKVFGALKRKPSLPPESLLWTAVIKTVRKRLPKAARVQTNVDQSLHNQDRQNESHLRWETRDALRAPQEYKHPDSSWPLSLSLSCLQYSMRMHSCFELPYLSRFDTSTKRPPILMLSPTASRSFIGFSGLEVISECRISGGFIQRAVVLLYLSRVLDCCFSTFFTIHWLFSDANYCLQSHSFGECILSGVYNPNSFVRNRGPF